MTKKQPPKPQRSKVRLFVEIPPETMNLLREKMAEQDRTLTWMVNHLLSTHPSMKGSKKKKA